MTHRHIIKNYLTLLRQIDGLSYNINASLAGHIACHAGCADCCRHITLFPVEAFALASAMRKLPPEQSFRIREHARAAAPESPCPLLYNELCLLYDARPVICRTHGMPLLMTGENGARQIDFCPLNFQGVESLPGQAIIDLDRLNETLATVNGLFVREWEGKGVPLEERLSIAEALQLDIHWEKCKA